MTVQFGAFAAAGGRLFTPEDYGGLGFSTMAAAMANSFDNTTAIQTLVNAVVSSGIRVRIPRLYYRCNSTVNIPMIGEIVFEGRIATPNTDITAIRCVGQSTLALEDKGGRIILGVENSNIVTPLWLGKTYPSIFDNAYSVYLATLEIWSSTKSYVPGDEVQLTAGAATGYRAKNTTIVVGNNPASFSAQWAAFGLDRGAGATTAASMLAAETNIGIRIDSMFNRSLEIEQASGYAIGVAVKPRALVDGSSQTAWSHFTIHSSQQNKVGLALISGGPTNWINECSFDCKNFAVSSSITAGARGLYGLVLMNDDALGNYWPNGNRFSGVDLEYAGALSCSEFIQVVIHKGFHNTFDHIRADDVGTRTVKIFRHPPQGAFLDPTDNPTDNEFPTCTRIQAGGVVNNGYQNIVREPGSVDLLSLAYSINDIGNRLVYSGSDKAMIRGLSFWNGTDFARFEDSRFLFKHYNTGRICTENNRYPGIVLYPGRRQYNSFWTLSMRGRSGRYGFHCFNAAGTIIGQAGATPSNFLVASGKAWFLAGTTFGQPSHGPTVDYDDTNAARDVVNNPRFSFHEVVDKAVFWFHGDELDGFELRAYNSPGARITHPGAYSEENVVITAPQKGQYTRPWRAMYETPAGGGEQQCILDVGSSAVPTSWATSGVWAGSGSAVLGEERHVTAGTDHRIYRCSLAGTVAATPPAGTVYGVEETPAGGTSKWKFMGIAEQIAAFVDV